MENKPFLLQIDTREKPDKNLHFLSYFITKGVKSVRSKMIVGDYCNYYNPNVVIDRKQNMAEICSNLHHDHERIRNEMILAQQMGVKLVILIECCDWTSVYHLKYWSPPVYKYGSKKGQKLYNANGEQIMKTMLTMHERYGVVFMFCKKADSGRIAYEILTGLRKVEQK